MLTDSEKGYIAEIIDGEGSLVAYRVAARNNKARKHLRLAA